MVPLLDRTSVVVEFDRAPTIVEEVKGDTTAVVLDAGPFAAAITPQHLTPPASAAAIESVSIAPFARPDGATYVRVRIAVHGDAGHRLRRAGTRVYVDFGAPQGSPAVRAADAAPGPVAGSDPRPPVAPPPASDTPATTPPAAVAANPEAAYRALDASVRARAGQMAVRPDVKGLLRLRSEVERRDKELGNRQPELVSPLFTDLLV